MSDIKYHDGSFLLSYNKLLIFDVGGRSIGKSFFWKLFVVNNFLRKKEKGEMSRFIYLRRHKNDIDIMNKENKFWADISIKLDGHKMETKSGETLTNFMIDDEICGYGMGLSSTVKMKSVPFPDVDYIIFDEFIDETGSYIGSKDNPNTEPNLCASLLMSVARGGGKVVRENVKMVFIGNTHDKYNPYFVFHKISERFKPDTKIINGPYWVVFKDPAEGIAEEIGKTQIGAMLKNTNYGMMAMGGGWQNEDGAYIGEMKGEKKYFCTLRSNGKVYGVFENTMGEYYISHMVDTSDLWKYALTKRDMRDGHVLATKETKSWKIQLLYRAWCNNMIIYQDAECKNMWEEYTSRRRIL